LNLCNNIIANTAVTNATTEMVCDSNQGSGGFNLQWSVTAAVSTQSVGTGTINLTGPFNLLDGIFVYHNRTTSGYTNQAGDTLYCDEYPAYQECQYVRENVAATGVTTEAQFDLSGTYSFGLSEGVVLPCLTGSSPAYAGVGTIDVCNGANGGGIFLSSVAGVPDSDIRENGSNGVVWTLGSGGTWALASHTSTPLLTYGVSPFATGWLLYGRLQESGLTSGGGVSRLCVSSSNEIVIGGC
jgi:hypothetical protein